MNKRLLVFLISAVVLTGCSANQNNTKSGQPANNKNIHEMSQSVKQNKRISNQQIANRLVNIADKTPGVRSATAVVLGDYAVVGIDLDKNLDRDRVGTIKYSVAQALKNDPYGANAVVTSDPDTVQRLREMGQGIREGKPVKGIADELANMVERIMPDTPRDVQKPSQNVKNPQTPNINQPNKQQP
ncbi:YhcN/YlaJ family sporulation lipoprotein [Scopulibacillus cellulosilyticus]|uniref:YhcN/YlaJ family sporulation lipoprotein n=1 Tax=Scopulibacillus cellulosilyticus TaxID=2665665 RepID=A0ABW2PTG8_9BACL